MPTLSQSLKREFHRSRTIIFVTFTFCMAAVLSFLSTSNMTTSSAADASQFNPGNIISDAVMSNYKSMTKDKIQAFLDSKNKCNNTDYNYYLSLTKAQPNIHWHWAGEPYNGHFVCLAEEKFGDGEVIGSGMTAAEIIYDAAKVNKINPQVLLVLLQKESSLITDKVPNDYDYRKATGYGCPDTAACDSKYFGFKNQIYRAAELFRYTLDHGSTTFREGHNNYVGYHPNASCGGTEVYIENRATASLYRYTPYQPNSAALNAGYGTGNACSAYGNRNFYLYFTDWFGSTQAVVDGEQIFIPDGTYSFVSAGASNRALGVSGDNVQLSTLDDTDDTQRWQIQRDSSTGAYTFTNVATNKRLDLTTSPAQDGTNVQIWSTNAVCDQQWKIYQTSDNYLTIETSCTSGMVLDTKDGSSSVGANIQTNLTAASTSQKWVLHTGQTVPEGNYSVTSSKATSSGLDIAEAKTTSGANVHFWDFLGNYNQLWHFKYETSTDSYIITNPYSDKNLDISSASYKSGTNIQIWEDNSTCAQRWKVTKTSDGFYHLIAACNYKYTVDLTNNPANGVDIKLWELHGGANQKWKLTPAVQGDIDDGIYTIAAKGLDSSALDISEGSTKPGANVYLWNLHGHYNQLWRLTYHPASDDYTITNPQSGHSLDVSSGLMQDGRNVQIYTDNSTCAQRWKITKTDDGYYKIFSSCNNNYALDLANSKIAAGSNLLIWTAQDSESQKWYFRPLR